MVSWNLNSLRFRWWLDTPSSSTDKVIGSLQNGLYREKNTVNIMVQGICGPHGLTTHLVNVTSRISSCQGCAKVQFLIKSLIRCLFRTLYSETMRRGVHQKPSKLTCPRHPKSSSHTWWGSVFGNPKNLQKGDFGGFKHWYIWYSQGIWMFRDVTGMSQNESSLKHYFLMGHVVFRARNNTNVKPS